MRSMYLATRQIFRAKNYLFWFFSISTVFLCLFVLLPVLIIPGNSLVFQLSIYTFSDYLLIITLALLVGLASTMQIYAVRRRMFGAKNLGAGFVGVLSAIWASVLGTVSCASCLVASVALLGMGASSAFFILEHRSYFLIASIVLVLASLYFNSRRVAGICETCR